jgi:hypothetical protein
MICVSNNGGALSTDILKRWRARGGPGDITELDSPLHPPHTQWDAGRATDFNQRQSRWLVTLQYLNNPELEPRVITVQDRWYHAEFYQAPILILCRECCIFHKEKRNEQPPSLFSITSNASPPPRVNSGG